MSNDRGISDTQAMRVLSVTRQRVEAGLARRYRRERRFRAYGIASVMFGVLFLGFLLVTIVGNGYSAFRQTHIRLDVTFDPVLLDPAGTGMRSRWRQPIIRVWSGRPWERFFRR